MIIEPGKFYKTRDGRKVRIYATDGGDGYPVHGAIFEDGIWLMPDAWTASGSFLGTDPAGNRDIIAEWAEPHPLANAKPGDVVWVRDCDESTWAIRLFMELNISSDTEFPVIACSHADLQSRTGWRFGKPYVPGEKP